MTVRRPPIVIGMPVYNGRRWISETLESIFQQTCRDFRLILAFDAGDATPPSVYAGAAADPRVTIVRQERRLGWAGNLQWLMDHADGDFFCYWQQDDLCDPEYLEVLGDYLDAHPDAACAYCDMQWFGGRSYRDVLPSITGDPLGRVLSLIDASASVPFRGLVRQAAIRRAGRLRLNAFDSRLEDHVWVARLAREGELHRVHRQRPTGAEILYYKRVHEANAHSYVAPPVEQLRGIWIEYGIGLLEAAWPVAGDRRRDTLLAILERLLLSREGRWMAYDPAVADPSGLARFGDAFLAAARLRLAGDPIPAWPSMADPTTIAALRARHACGVTPSDESLARLDELHRRRVAFDGLQQALHAGEMIDLHFGAGALGPSLLGDGWSCPEEWGVWNDGPAADLLLPFATLPGGTELLFEGQALIDPAAGCPTQRVIARLGEDQDCAKTVLDDGRPSTVRLTVPAGVPGSGDRPGSGNRNAIPVSFEFPDAVSPSTLGRSDDRRRLAFGLSRLRVTPPSAGKP
jgi:glycosyltransferase involved in cell wall biosynthesis